MFVCPSCGIRQTRQFKAGCWTCSNCFASLVTLQFLSQLAGKEHVEALRSTMKDRSQASARPCPVCAKAMRAFLSPTGDTGVELDGCPRCNLVWFDSGEMTRTVQRNSVRQAAVQSRRVGKALAREGVDIDVGAESPRMDWAVSALLELPLLEGGPKSAQSPLALGAISLVIALASISGFYHFNIAVENLGFVPAHAFRHHGITWFSQLCVHAGWMHLIGNLYFLIIFGAGAEAFLGSERALELFFWSAVGGALGPFLLNSQSTVPHIGASGLVMGVAVFFVLRFPRAKMRVFFFSVGPGDFVDVGLSSLRLPAWLLIGFMLFNNLLSVGQELAGIAEVSYLSHLGGAAAGFLYWVASSQRRPRRPFVRPAASKLKSRP